MKESNLIGLILIPSNSSLSPQQGPDVPVFIATSNLYMAMKWLKGKGVSFFFCLV